VARYSRGSRVGSCVAQFIALGSGARLGITERGVKHHVSQLLMLYAVMSRAELIAIVLGRKR
jgi:DNA-binding NarL/FixJ family response regulator